VEFLYRIHIELWICFAVTAEDIHTHWYYVSETVPSHM